MSSLERLQKIKGIGKSTVDKIKKAGIVDVEIIKKMNVDQLVKIGIPKGTSETIIEGLKNPDINGGGAKKPKSISTKEMEIAENNRKYSRSYQFTFDDKNRVPVFKFNFNLCEECFGDARILSCVFWQDQKTKQRYIRQKTVCGAGCIVRERLYELIEPKNEPYEDFSLPE